MSIKLARFATEKDIVLPILNKVGKFQGRKISLNVPDGWYSTKLGTSVIYVKPASELEIKLALDKCPVLRFYPIGNEGVPLNFESLKRRGMGETVEILFLNTSPWDIIQAGLWEDNHYYFIGFDYGADREVLNQVKTKFETKQIFNDIKGITPELRYYTILLSLQKQTLETLETLERLNLSSAERTKRLKEFQSTFQGRLRKVVADAGGELVNFYKRGAGRYLIVWKSGRQTIKTIINDKFRIYDAGYCLSGEDKKHSMSSIIALAKTFQRQAPLYLTRT